MTAKIVTERNLLEKETEDILKEFGLGHIVDINFQVLTGYLVDVPRQANENADCTGKIYHKHRKI